MAKSKKQKTVGWLKMPVNLMDDEHIAELLAHKGVAGLGVYVSILGEMYRRQSRRLSMTQVKALKFAGATQKTIMSVVEESGLFRKDKMGYVYSTVDYLGFEDDLNEHLLASSRQALDENENESDAKRISIGFESPSIPTPAREYKDIDKDKEKDKEKEKNYHHHDGADFIGLISVYSEWTEVALMKSGFGTLIKRNWQVALDAFRNHAIANCTIESIRSVDDAKKYFHFYISHPTSGNKLRKALEDYERLHPRENPYRFEDMGSSDGHRSYHGIQLPDDAPPRPDERADWDYENNCWILI